MPIYPDGVEIPGPTRWEREGLFFRNLSNLIVLRDKRFETPAARSAAAALGDAYAEQVLRLHHIALLDARAPGVLDWLTTIFGGSDRSLLEWLNAGQTVLGQIEPDNNKPDALNAYRSVRDRAREICRQLFDTPLAGAVGRQRSFTLDVDFDEDLWGPKERDRLTLTNRSGRALGPLILTVTLHGPNDARVTNTHVVREWPANRALHAAYDIDRGEEEAQTLRQVDSVSVQARAATSLHDLTYAYAGAERDADIETYLRDLEIRFPMSGSVFRRSGLAVD